MIHCSHLSSVSCHTLFFLTFERWTNLQNHIVQKHTNYLAQRWIYSRRQKNIKSVIVSCLHTFLCSRYKHDHICNLLRWAVTHTSIISLFLFLYPCPISFLHYFHSYTSVSSLYVQWSLLSGMSRHFGTMCVLNQLPLDYLPSVKLKQGSFSLGWFFYPLFLFLTFIAFSLFR